MNSSRRKLWYFGLEPLQERYTYQLSEEWIPETFKSMDVDFISIKGETKTNQINVGSVLDAYGRGVYSMQQCQKFMNAILNGLVSNGDIIYLQDFWTPGIESIFYMLDLYNIKVKLYSMLHAQSVDEYDFTHQMKNWMRHFELGIDSRHDGIFVGSTIHKEQLRAAGFKSPIHVVSLPIHKSMALKVNPLDNQPKYKQVIYTSRLDKEKNPYFMVKVAVEFLKRNPDFVWVITTSGAEFKSSVDGFVSYMEKVAVLNDRFILKKNLTKAEYYGNLKISKVQFNSSLQDYVSWTLIESTMYGCDVVYPNFRSFPEIIDADRLYAAFNTESALKALQEAIEAPRSHQHISDLSDLGRRLEAFIMLTEPKVEFNIWHESEFIKRLLK